MANDLELKVRIRAQLGELQKGLDAVQKELDETGAKGAKAGKAATEGISGLERAVNRAGAAIGGFLTIYAALGAVKTIANLTDDYARFNAQLKLNTSSAEELTVAQREVFRIAQETRAPVADVANTYASLARSTKTLGVSQEELVNVLETVNKSIALTPVSAETAKATLVQFGQALSGDFKNGAQELNSILEQTPGLADAIAKGLGTTSDRLKFMGESGELSAEKVFLALQKVGTEIDAQFAQIPLTVGGALTQMQNDVLVTFGNTDVTPLTDAISDMRATLTDPATVEGLATLAAALVNLTALAAEAASEFADLGKQVGYFAASVTGNVTPLDELQRKIKDIDRALNNSVLGKPIGYLFTSEEYLEAEKSRLEALVATYERAQGIKRPDPGAEKAAADAKRKAMADEANAALEAANAQAKLKAEQEATRKAAEQRQNQINGIIQGLRDEAATYGKSADEVVRYRLALLGASQAEIDRGVALAKKIDAMKAEDELIEESAKKIEEKKKAEEQLARDLDEIRIRSLEASSKTVEARAAQLAQQYNPIIDQLKAKGDDAGVKLVQGLINTELAQAKLDELGEKVKAKQDELAGIGYRVSGTEASVADRIAAGDTSGAEGRAELQEARQEAIADLEKLRAEFQLLATQGAPEAATAIGQIDAQIANLSGQNVTGAEAAMRQLRTEVAELEDGFAGDAITTAADSLGDALFDMATGAASASEAFRNMAQAFIQALIRMAAEALAKKAILAMVGAFTGGGESAAAVGGFEWHTGGVVGRSGKRRSIPAFMLAGAPRYHSGGFAGLAPGEVPAILQTGEEVLARNDPRNSLNSGGQASGGNGVRIVNVIDPAMVQDYLSTAAGEKVIMNVLQRNSGAVKQVLT